MVESTAIVGSRMVIVAITLSELIALTSRYYSILCLFADSF
jgi:hypothetical protein